VLALSCLARLLPFSFSSGTLEAFGVILLGANDPIPLPLPFFSFLSNPRKPLALSCFGAIDPSPLLFFSFLLEP